MDGWRTVGGVDWLCAERAPEVGWAELGLVLPRGYAHEDPAEIGITAAAATALARRIARPLETADHRIVEPELGVSVGLQETVIAVSGEPEAVRLGARALEQLLREPGDLEAPDPTEPRRFAWTGWNRELAVWLGVGSAVLAAENEVAWVGDPARFSAFVADLWPGRGGPAVGWTTEPDLVGAVFADAPPGPEPAARPVDGPLAWRDPSPTSSAGSAPASYRNNLLTARAPRGPLDGLARQLLSRTVHRSLVTMMQLVSTLEVTAEPIGTEVLYALLAVPKEGTTDWFAVREALVQAVDAFGEVVDSVLADELDQARARQTGPDLVNRAVDALHSGRRSDPYETPPDLVTATVADLRAATHRLRAGVLIGVPDGEVASAGRSLFRPADLAPVSRPTLRRRSTVALWLRDIPDRQSLRADASTLQQTLVPKTRKAGPGALSSVTTAVDLTAVAVRIDRGDVYSTLVDRDDRRLTLVWPAYRRVAPLRALVDAATPANARIVRTAEPMAVAQLRSDLRRHRVTAVLTTALLVIAAVLIVWHPVSGRAYQDPVASTVPVGTVITLGNGTTVRVSDPQWRESKQVTYPVLVLDVRYCGGGETVDRNTADDARNYLSPQRFSLTGITPASRQVYLFGPDEPALKETQLEQGQCTEGKIGFDIDAEKPAGIVVAYHNGSGDQLQWSL